MLKSGIIHYIHLNTLYSRHRRSKIKLKPKMNMPWILSFAGMRFLILSFFISVAERAVNLKQCGKVFFITMYIAYIVFSLIFKIPEQKKVARNIS